MKETLFGWGDILQVLGCLLLVILIFGSILAASIAGSTDKCVAGGYAVYRSARRQGLCLGVNSDGEWHVETYESVQERVGD